MFKNLRARLTKKPLEWEYLLTIEIWTRDVLTERLKPNKYKVLPKTKAQIKEQLGYQMPKYIRKHYWKIEEFDGQTTE